MIVNNRKPFGNPNAKADITGVFEILIPEEIWERIKKAQTKHFRLTYSWIVRYMLSKLLRRKKFWQKVKVKKLKFEDKQYSKKRDDCHRFSLCLYGEDQVHLKTLAASLGISVSFLVRAAIFWYLDEFDADEIPDIMEGASEFRRYGKLSFEKVKKYGTHRMPFATYICGSKYMCYMPNVKKTFGDFSIRYAPLTLTAVSCKRYKVCEKFTSLQRSRKLFFCMDFF